MNNLVQVDRWKRFLIIEMKSKTCLWINFGEVSSSTPIQAQSFSGLQLLKWLLERFLIYNHIFCISHFIKLWKIFTLLILLEENLSKPGEVSQSYCGFEKKLSSFWVGQCVNGRKEIITVLVGDMKFDSLRSSSSKPFVTTSFADFLSETFTHLLSLSMWGLTNDPDRTGNKYNLSILSLPVQELMRSCVLSD